LWVSKNPVKPGRALPAKNEKSKNGQFHPYPLSGFRLVTNPVLSASLVYLIVYQHVRRRFYFSTAKEKFIGLFSKFVITL
jgi:hypothetical protein